MKEHFQIKDRFFDIICKNPSRDGFVTFVKESCGEQDNIDFKEKWIEKSKLAKIMLAIANSGGGMVVIGIKDNKGKGYEPIGIEELWDSAKVEQSIAICSVKRLLLYFRYLIRKKTGDNNWIIVSYRNYIFLLNVITQNINNKLLQLFDNAENSIL